MLTFVLILGGGEYLEKGSPGPKVSTRMFHLNLQILMAVGVQERISPQQ
jgi:hypothetical protein